MIIVLLFIVYIAGERKFFYNGAPILKNPEIIVILYGSPNRYEYHDYIVNKEMEEYLKLLCTQLEWLKEYGHNALPTYKGTFVLDIGVDLNDIRVSSVDLSNFVYSANVTNTENSIYLVFFPKGKSNLITSNGGVCNPGIQVCNRLAFITDPSMGITIIPGKRNLFQLGIAFTVMTILGLLSWPLISCSTSYKCWKNGISCGINITGRTIFHIGMLTLILVLAIPGAFYMVIGLVDYRDELYWTGIGLMIGGGSVLLLWYVIYMITIALESTTKEEWFFSYKVEGMKLFNIVYGVGVVIGLLVSGIVFWQSLLPAVYLSTSHEMIEMLTYQWTLGGKQICDMCLLEWRDMGDKYMQKCWSNLYQMCY